MPVLRAFPPPRSALRPGRLRATAVEENRTCILFTSIVILVELTLIAERHRPQNNQEKTFQMHIPDGYLSPATCAVGYLVALPFWYVALNKVKRKLNTQLVPMIAAFSAFSFVIMMFNLPVPGGTTAHAIGVALAAIVLGPWAAILVVSVALLIQALFFGDGGITAFGFNSVNMGVIGAFAAYWVYRAIAGRASVVSVRRVVAAAAAGYVAINAAALATAIEFGLQPLLFHAADGTPLYAPYPLVIAVPAMMLAHLTIAGAAEAICAGGVVAWLQRSNPSVLEMFTPTSSTATDTAPASGGWRHARPLWIALAVLMILTPLGLLATADAWGEWGAEDFLSNNAVIAAQSLGHAVAAQIPQGMAALEALWTAPIPDYAPAFMQSEAFGYVLSAFLGAVLILLTFFCLSWLTHRRRRLVSGD